ncbi:cellular communication network factor 1, like 1 [Aplochiton taeniatus]
MTQCLSSLVLLYFIYTVQGNCPDQCSCPSSPPSCAAGVSWVLDGCGCCKVCASQYNQDCSASQPCDHIKGLQCHLEAEGGTGRGLCRAKTQGRPCELDGRLYQHGEDFHPSCQHQCSCMDGVVGCMPLCPQQVAPPDWRCARPRLARLPGRCCEEWLCDDRNHIEEGDSADAGNAAGPRPGVAAPHRDRDFDNNELLLVPSAWDSSAAAAPHQEWIPSRQSHSLPPPSCFLQITDWSPCSATCGMGVSSRVTNSNAECRLSRETRLCQIRPCDLSHTQSTKFLKKWKKCQRTFRPPKPERLFFGGCSTAHRYRPRSCGSCSDGLCCAPSVTRTVRLRFRCPGDRQDFTRSMMWIQRCRCSQDCPRRGLASVEQHSQPNDIHIYS